MEPKVALVTGSSKGIGKAIAIKLARDGYEVLLHYNKGKEAAIEVQKEITLSGGRSELVGGDISVKAQAQDIVEAAFKYWDHVDLLVNNSGVVRDKSFVFMEDQDWYDVINTNLNGTYNVTRALVYKMLRRRSGCIINIGSVAGSIGIAGQVNYCASKAGIEGFTRALSVELAPYGIRVNCIAPGYIETDMTRSMKSKKQEEAKRQVPMKRFGVPDEVAAAVSFLSGVGGKYITGQVYRVDGGLTS